MTASVIIATLALIVTATMCITVTVLVSRALAASFRTLDAMDARKAKQIDGLLDRFQAIRWEDLVALRTLDVEESGGFDLPPESPDQPTLEVVRPGGWQNDSDRLKEETERLLREDFGADR